MKIFITGATGFVGKHVTMSFLKKGYQVSCLIRNVSKANKFFNSQVELVEGDLVNLAPSLINYLVDADVVCHLAACVTSSKTKDFFDVNVHGTQNLCDLLIKSRRLRKFIYLSSLSVIGRNQMKPITEKTRCWPYSPYGKSKLKAEEILTSFHSKFPGIQLFILRAPVIYGEGQVGMISEFFKNIENGKIVLLGNGENIRSMCYIRNLNDAIITLVDKEGISNRIEVVNIADRRQLNLKELVRLVAREMGINVKIKHLSMLVSNIGLILFKFFNWFGFNSIKLFILATASANIQCNIEKALSLDIPVSYTPGVKLKHVA